MNEFEIGEQEPGDFERQLTQALRHVDAPEGFAARVMEHAATAEESLPVPPRFLPPRIRAWVGGTIAAMLVLGLLAAEQVHLRHEREQVALARQQFETAMRVTDHALDQTRVQLEHAGLGWAIR